MSKIQLEELESRLVLSSFSLSPDISLLQPSPASAGYSSAAAPDASHAASPFRPGGGVNLGQAQAPIPNAPFAETRVNINVEEFIFGGSQQVMIVEVSVTPIVFSLNFDSPQLTNAGPENVVDAVQTDHMPATNFSAATSSPLAASVAAPAPVASVSQVVAQATTASPAPASNPTAGANAGFLFNPNSIQPHALTSFSGYSSPSEIAGPSGMQAQSWLFPPPRAASMAGTLFFTPSLLGSRSLDGQALLPRQVPSLPLGPLSQQEALLPELNLSSLPSRLQPFLGVLGFQGQQALSLAVPDLSALESGLLQFLSDLGETSSQLVVSPEGAALRMWLYAAVAAGAASALAYRQQRRWAGRWATEVPELPGCSLDDA